MNAPLQTGEWNFRRDNAAGRIMPRALHCLTADAGGARIERLTSGIIKAPREMQAMSPAADIVRGLARIATRETEHVP
jgi:hypothetical protein